MTKVPQRLSSGLTLKLSQATILQEALTLESSSSDSVFYPFTAGNGCFGSFAWAAVSWCEEVRLHVGVWSRAEGHPCPPCPGPPDNLPNSPAQAIDAQREGCEQDVAQPGSCTMEDGTRCSWRRAAGELHAPPLPQPYQRKAEILSQQQTNGDIFL